MSIRIVNNSYLFKILQFYDYKTLQKLTLMWLRSWSCTYFLLKLSLYKIDNCMKVWKLVLAHYSY